MQQNQTVVVVDPYYTVVHPLTMDLIAVFVSVSFCLGISGNTLVILVHQKIKEKSATDWMIFYIAVCDILSLLSMPMYICQIKLYWQKYRFPDILCKLQFVHSNSISMASFLFCSCTALERYSKVVASKEIFTSVRAKWLSIPVFVVSYGIGSLAFKAVTNNANGHCSFDIEVIHFSNICYGSVLFVAFSASIVMSICYIRTGVFLLDKMKEIAQSGNNDNFSRSNRNMIQTTKMLAIMTIVFLFSANSPYISGFIVTFTTPSGEPWMSLLFMLSGMFVVNNFFNPFLYMAMSITFRRRSAEVLHSCRRSKYEADSEISRSTQDTNT